MPGRGEGVGIERQSERVGHVRELVVVELRWPGRRHLGWGDTSRMRRRTGMHPTAAARTGDRLTWHDRSGHDPLCRRDQDPVVERDEVQGRTVGQEHLELGPAGVACPADAGR